ncbi:MAG: hypothetical protein V8Q75_03435 [Bacilli bacterium]
MYQVIINDKYYVSDVDVRAQDINGRVSLLFGFETTTNKYNAKFFEYKEEAQSIAEHIGGKVIEYVEKKNIQIEVKCNVNMEDICNQLEVLKHEQ